MDHHASLYIAVKLIKVSNISTQPYTSISLHNIANGAKLPEIYKYHVWSHPPYCALAATRMQAADIGIITTISWT